MTVGSAKPPLIPKSLGRGPATLDDEATWEEAHVTELALSSHESRDITFLRSRLTGVSLTGRVISQLRCVNVEFLRCDLSGAVWDSASLDRVAFRDCRMTGLVLSGSRLVDVRIADSGGELVNFRMAKAKRLHIESSVLRAADFQDAALAQSRIEDCDLRGASFQRAQLADVSLRGSKLDDVRGVGSLRGARVTPGQAIMLGSLLLAETGIEVEG